MINDKEKYTELRNKYLTKNETSFLYALYKEKGGYLTPSQFGVLFLQWVNGSVRSMGEMIRDMDSENEIILVQDLKTNKIIKVI